MSKANPRVIGPTQKALDSIPLGTGETYRVSGVLGLFVRSHKTMLSFFVQRRVRGALPKVSLGALSMRDAKNAASKLYGSMKPKPAVGDVLTLQMAYEKFMIDRKDKHSDSTKAVYAGNYQRHLEKNWGKLALKDIAEDRPGVRQLYRDVKEGSGLATARSVIKLLSAIYEWARGEDRNLPESPVRAVELDRLRARDWALDDDGLRSWWAATKEETPLVRMFYTICLLTGCRRGSAEAIEWRDVDLDAGTLYFRVAKGGRAYETVMSEQLKKLLAEWRQGSKPGDRWVLPSPKKHGEHVTQIGNRSHHLRHQYKSTAPKVGVTELFADILQGHAMTGTSRGYVSTGVLGDSLREATNKVSGYYARVLGLV